MAVWEVCVFVAACYLVAGTIKGFLGLGLPTTAITLMTFFFSPLQALAVNLIPMLLTNLFQVSKVDDLPDLVRRYGLFAVALTVSIFGFSFVTAQVPEDALRLIVAVTVMVFAVYNLIGKPIKLSPEKDKIWQVVLGVSAGLMGALTSMWAVPLVIYLISKNLTPKAFVDASGFLLLVGCVPLAVGYIATGLVTMAVLGPAAIGTVAALLGFRIGEALRGKVEQTRFRQILLWFFFLMGVRMMLVAFN